MQRRFAPCSLAHLKNQLFLRLTLIVSEKKYSGQAWIYRPA